MHHRLFQDSVHNFVQQKLHEARSKVEQLSHVDLDASDLAETLEKIAKIDFQIAKMNPDQKKGKRRTEKRMRMDYGQQITVDIDMIDVSIPFEGWPKSFHLRPTSSNVIDTPARIENTNIIVSFFDDEDLERNIDNFVKSASENLSSLTQDLKNFEKQTLREVQAVANERILQINARVERDKGRSFPIE